MAYKFNPFTGKLDNTGPEVTALNTLGVKADLATIQAIVGPSVGDVWQADDTDIFYLWDGSSWVSLGTLGTPGPTGATGATGADGTDGVGVPVGGTTGQVLKKSSGTDYDTAWGGADDIYVISCSDETTALTTGTGKVTFRMPSAGTLTAVKATLTTAPVGSAFIVDINEAGTSVLSTKLSIDDGEKTSTTAATSAVISDSALADDAEITIDIDQVGSGTAGAGLKVYLYITRG